MDIFFSAKHLIWPDIIRLPSQTFFVFCLIHERTSEQVKSVNNAVVVLKLLPEAFCNLFIVKSSSLRSCTQTKAQNVSCSKCLYFALFFAKSLIFCLPYSAYAHVYRMLEFFCGPSLNYLTGVMKT